MPFKSEAQRRLFYAKARRGKMPESTVKKWEAHTPKGKLPEKVKKAELVSLFAELDKLMDKEADLRGEITKRVGGFGERLLGKNVQRAIQKGEEKVLAHPIVAENMQWGEKPIRRYVSDVLKGSKEHIHPKTQGKIVPYNPANPYETTSLDVSKLLHGARDVVKGEQAATRKARLLTAGAAVPAVGVPAGLMLKENAEKPKKTESKAKLVAPIAAGAAAGSIPIAKGISEGALSSPRRMAGQRLSFEQLSKSLKPGDVLMTGAGGSGTPTPITLAGGDPRAFHAEVVHEVPEAGKYHGIHSMGGKKRGGQALRTKVQMSPEGHYIIRRVKDPELRKALLEGTEGIARQEEALHRAFGPHARSTQYQKSLQRSSAVRNLLPKLLRNLLPESRCAGGICSTLPAEAAPALVPSHKAKDVLPPHLLTTPTMETVGHFSPELSKKHRIMLRLKGIAPWALRGAAGLGLGYGAYKGVQKLMEDKEG